MTAAEERQAFLQRCLAGTPRSLAEFDALVEALAQFTENNNCSDLTDEDDEDGPFAGWKAKTAAAQAMLDRCVAEICALVKVTYGSQRFYNVAWVETRL